MPHDPQRLKSALTNLLTIAASTLSDPPDRKIITPGEPAHDCGQLAVWASPLRSVVLAQPNEFPPPRSQPRQRVATLNVLYLGAVCYGPNLSAETINEIGESMAVAGWSLFCGLLDAIGGDVLLPVATFGPTAFARNLTLAEVQRQEGDRAGWRLTVEVGL